MSCFHHTRALVLEQVRLAQDTNRIRLAAGEIASTIVPGQFVMLRLPDTSDPLLGRPFALYDTVLDSHRGPSAIDIVYLVVGKMTRRLAEVRPGELLEVWGPLGNGFPDLTGIGHVGLVAGGIGQTPFLAYIRQLLGSRGYASRAPTKQVERISLYYGVRSAKLAAGVADFEEAGARVLLATDDGSLGFHGFVTQVLETTERPDHLVGCGPEPMMKALAGLAAGWGIPCHLSLESPMACGIGICFSCVAKVRTDQGWDYRRICVEGPVFDAAKLIF